MFIQHQISDSLRCVAGLLGQASLSRTGLPRSVGITPKWSLCVLMYELKETWTGWSAVIPENLSLQRTTLRVAAELER